MTVGGPPVTAGGITYRLNSWTENAVRTDSDIDRRVLWIAVIRGDRV